MYPDKMWCIVMAALGCVYAPTVEAQIHQRTQKADAHDMNPIVVTATGTHNRAKESTTPVQVITAKELQDIHANSLEEALTRLCPTLTSMTNGMGTFLSMNGLSEDYLIVLVNGHRLSGDDRYTRINMANVRRIEILNGAASALYGSDAIGGVINIITDDDQRHVSVSNQTQLRSKGRFAEAISANVNQGRFGSHTSYQRLQADNWQVNQYELVGSEEKLTGRPMSAAYASDNLSQKFDWRFTDRLTAYARGGIYDYNTHRPQAATYYTYSEKTDKFTEKTAYNYDLHHRSFDYGAGAKYKVTDRTYLEADLSVDNYISKYRYFRATGDFIPGDQELREKTHRYDATVKGIFQLADWNKLSAGAEYIHETFQSASNNISFEDMGTAALFLQDELSVGRHLGAVVGLRYLHNNQFGSYATPNASLVGKLGDLRLRAAYATGFRAPSLLQLYATDQAKTTSRMTLANGDLKPEKSNYYSLGGEYTNNRVSVGVQVYWNRVRDMINYRTLTDDEIAADPALTALHADWQTLRQRDNIDRANVFGVTANARFDLGRGFVVGGSYAYMDTEAKSRQADGTWNVTPVDKSLKHSGNVMAQWAHRWHDYRLNVTFNGHMQSPRYSSTYSAKLGDAPAVQQFDLHTTHTFYLRHTTLEPAIGIENLFNQRDTRLWNSNFSTINPGRSVYVAFRLTFND